MTIAVDLGRKATKTNKQTNLSQKEHPKTFLRLAFFTPLTLLIFLFILTTEGKFLGVDDPASSIPIVLVDSCPFSSLAVCGIPPLP